MGKGWGTPRQPAKVDPGVVRFADPYKKCRECSGWVDGAKTGPGQLTLPPCLHQSDYEDVCPSWSPVDGCGCDPLAAPHEMRPPTPNDGKVY